MAKVARAKALVLTFLKTRQGRPSEIAQAFKTLLEFYKTPKNVIKELPVVKKDWTIKVWSKVADWSPEALEILDSGKVYRSLVFELACRPDLKNRLVKILREVSTMPSWKEGKMFIQRIFKEPQKKRGKIKKEVSKEYQEEEVCVALLAVPYELKHKLDRYKVEEAIQRWIREEYPEIPDVKVEKPSPYSVVMPRWMYAELKKHGNPADLLGRIIRAYYKSKE